MTVALQVTQGATTVTGSAAQSTLKTGLITGVECTSAISGSTPSSYTWTLAKPTGSGAALSSSTAASPTFTPDLAGTYLLQLIDQAQTIYTLPLAVVSTGTVTTTGPLAVAYCAPAAVATPDYGVVLFCNSSNGGALSIKNASGDVHAVTLT